MTTELEKQRKIQERLRKLLRLEVIAEVHKEVLQLVDEGATISEINNHFVNEAQELKEEIEILLAEKL
jgi:hypothetical protein